MFNRVIESILGLTREMTETRMQNVKLEKEIVKLTKALEKKPTKRTKK